MKKEGKLEKIIEQKMNHNTRMNILLLTTLHHK